MIYRNIPPIKPVDRRETDTGILAHAVGSRRSPQLKELDRTQHAYALATAEFARFHAAAAFQSSDNVIPFDQAQSVRVHRCLDTAIDVQEAFRLLETAFSDWEDADKPPAAVRSVATMKADIRHAARGLESLQAEIADIESSLTQADRQLHQKLNTAAIAFVRLTERHMQPGAARNAQARLDSLHVPPPARPDLSPLAHLQPEPFLPPPPPQFQPPPPEYGNLELRPQRRQRQPSESAAGPETNTTAVGTSRHHGRLHRGGA
jgi:hypothetical protein